MSKLKLSYNQKIALDSIFHFALNKNDLGFVLSGVAGSGKTTILSNFFNTLTNDLGLSVAALSFTGKACSSMITKGISPTYTIHSFLYVPVFETVEKDDLEAVSTPVYSRKIIRFDKRDRNLFNHIDLIVVDEAGFVSEEIFKDLIDLKIPILFVGDKEQLPPINDNGFNVMDHPNIHLEEIHRQAESNPIIMLSKVIRETGLIDKRYVDGNYIKMLNRLDINKNYFQTNKHDIVLCGTNNTRTRTNRLIRTARNFKEDYAEDGEQIILLRNSALCVNDSSWHSAFNGDMFSVLSSYPKSNYRKYNISNHNNSFWCDIGNNTWIDEKDDMETYYTGVVPFAFGYSITVHKSQGSEFNDVLYIDEDVNYFTDQRKFRYTAVTRAKNNLTIVK